MEQNYALIWYVMLCTEWMLHWKSETQKKNQTLPVGVDTAPESCNRFCAI